MQEPVPDLKFLEGQPGYVIIAVVLIGAAAWVITRLVKRSGDTGEGKEGLAAVDSAAEYLAEKALEEREGRRVAESGLKAAETSRDAALSELRGCRDELTAAIAARELADLKLADCERRAQDMARKARREEDRRRADPDA